MADLGMLGECVDWVLVADVPIIKLGAMYGTDEEGPNFNKFITDPSLPHKMFSASSMAISKVADLPGGQKSLRLLMSDGDKEDVSLALLSQFALQASNVEHKPFPAETLKGFYTQLKPGKFYKRNKHSKHAILLNPQTTKCEVGKIGFVFKVMEKLQEVSAALKKGSTMLEEKDEAGKIALEQAHNVVNSTSHSGKTKDGLALEGAIAGLEAGVAERGWRDRVLDMVIELASIGREEVPFGTVMVHVKGALKADYLDAL
ncbi:hypothetical protein B484DRAFT_463469 [Ochromonadaceae sp. CCMP2298]|nr:hypothetical protein B484DRAFT_463469 [Ochromonadaceae sp. CCMP2298]